MQHHLTIANNNSTLTVHRGDTVTIELDENPTTGYNWNLSTPDPQMIQVQANDYRMASTAMGGGGMRKIELQATGTGSTIINLNYTRPWSGEMSETFRVQLQVV